MHAALTPRTDVFDTYWRFAAERQAIFTRRQLGAPAPWSEDPILVSFKFCNVFRASDRVSQYLIREVAYAEEQADPSDVLFRIIAFRLFSQPATWDFIVEHLGHQPTLDDLASSRFEDAVVSARRSVAPLYTNAFILCATDAFGRTAKHLNHVELLKLMFLVEEAGQKLLDSKSLSDIYSLLKSFPLLGPFMAYQIAIDLNYSQYINFSENDFTVAGPGALRGIKKAFVNCGHLKAEDVIQWMVANQEAEFRRLGLEFNGLGGRSLHAIDCQGLFCELDKYCRVAFPELASNRSRIKTKFKPASNGFDLFLPPKWGISSLAPIPAADEQLQLNLA